jgi:membrane-associated phospholipid phosphatase
VRKLEAIAGVTLALVVVGSVAPCRAQSAPDPVARPEAVQADEPDSQPVPAEPGPLAAAAARAQDFDPQAGSVAANVFDVPKDRRTMSAFPKNLGRNFIGVFSGQNLFPFAVGAGATVLASAFDSTTQHALKGSCDTCGQGGSTLGGGSVMVPIVAGLFVAGRFAPEGGEFRAASYDFMQAMIVTGAYSGILKYSVKRERPDGSDSLSFPSGHTSVAFSLATVATSHYGWKIGVPAYALATGIGLSRIEQNRHHLSDVIGGAALGLIVGRTVTRVDGEPATKKRVVSLTPATDARGQGLGLGVSASW